MRYPLMAVLALAGVSTGHAQAIPANDSVRVETIERLLDVMGMDSLVKNMQEMMIAQFVKVNPIVAQYESLFRDLASRHLSFQAMKGDLIRVYRDTFTEAEFQAFLAFYETDVGKSVLRKLQWLWPRPARSALHGWRR